MSESWLRELLLEQTDIYQALKAEAALATEYTMGGRPNSFLLLPFIFVKQHINGDC